MANIHAQLQSDCTYLGRFPLCHLLLANDANYPWFILVPDRDDIREIYQLDDRDRQQLLDESCRLSAFLMQTFNGEKLNVAALGNQVAQLHLHHIVRYPSDPAWPGPIWGKVPSIMRSASETADIKAKFSMAKLESLQLI